MRNCLKDDTKQTRFYSGRKMVVLVIDVMAVAVLRL